MYLVNIQRPNSKPQTYYASQYEDIEKVLKNLDSDVVVSITLISSVLDYE